VAETIAAWTLALTLIDRKIEFYGEWLVTGTRPTSDALARSGAGRAAGPPRARRRR
jgi:hypothetical protein